MSLRVVHTKTVEFFNDRSGAITAFTAVIAIMLVVASGMAVDFMRHEAKRAELQNALDRGVLAAASMSQSMEIEQTVQGYIRSATFAPDDISINISTLSGLTGREVQADVSFEMRTYFLKLVGIPSMTVAARAGAAESVESVEISLALDVSTSMSFETTGATGRTRLDVMQDAAKSFVDSVLGSQDAQGVTVSLIPFAGQVNPGPTARDYLITGRSHQFANCVEFDGSSFETTELPAPGSEDQMQFFSYSSYYQDYIDHGGATPPGNSGAWGENLLGLPNSVELGWCPKGNAEQVEYMSNDAEGLKERIRTLRTHEATGTQYGMKWAAALLDGSNQDLTAELVAEGDLPPGFEAYPRPNQDNAMKIIVIMTDGNTTDQMRIRPESYDDWWEKLWWAISVIIWGVSPFDYDDFYTHISADDSRQQFVNACNAAKALGITVFAVGFDVVDGSPAHDDMLACASSDSHYYHVDGDGLEAAFQAIGSTVNKLRLTH